MSDCCKGFGYHSPDCERAPGIRRHTPADPAYSSARKLNDRATDALQRAAEQDAIEDQRGEDE